MIDRKEIIREVERRTYFSGVLKGKYRGELSFQNSDLSYETLYDIEIYEGFIETEKSSIIKWSETQKIKALRSSFKHVKVYKAPIPKEIPLKIKDIDKDFITPLYDLKIDFKEDSLFNHQIQDNEVYGEIEARVFGYFTHIEEVVEYIDIPKVVKTISEVDIKKQGEGKTDGDTSEPRPDGTGKSKTPYFDIFDFFQFLGGLMLILLVLAVLIPILIYGWRLILIALVIGFILYLFSLFEAQIRVLTSLILNLLLLVIAVFFIYLIFSTIDLTVTPNPIPVLVDNTHETENEVTVIETIPDNENDSLIVNRRHWTDYSGRDYSGAIKVFYSDFINSRNYRNSYPSNLYSERDYNTLLHRINQFDRQNLNKVYRMLDSIRVANQLNPIEFAEAIVTFVQDIPYTLLLDKACSSYIYNDSFITEYLNAGGECVGYTRFGLHNPVEFAATLKGDCDTRTVFLFTILNNFGYDIVILGSQLYSHSILGINLPYFGTYKNVRGKKYYVWETTARGFRAGQLPREISNMNHWSVNLINTQL